MEWGVDISQWNGRVHGISHKTQPEERRSRALFIEVRKNTCQEYGHLGAGHLAVRITVATVVT